eukprot:CAMPEP_0179201088 /NCGR_PEP_ID=MMETSP0796-20121207/100078_1 /TAXON_ID=73915 /ORGANISM="Pyrodinium bahamense, Strain pbaha01" /LENGTH=280 /DNA_ID=CAMNT_0020905645 /DNA_START=68 /DNA_END=911 /DNA_ORIENTATION=-
MVARAQAFGLGSLSARCPCLLAVALLFVAWHPKVSLAARVVPSIDGGSSDNAGLVQERNVSPIYDSFPAMKESAGPRIKALWAAIPRVWQVPESADLGVGKLAQGVAKGAEVSVKDGPKGPSVLAGGGPAALLAAGAGIVAAVLLYVQLGHMLHGTCRLQEPRDPWPKAEERVRSLVAEHLWEDTSGRLSKRLKRYLRRVAWCLDLISRCLEDVGKAVVPGNGLPCMNRLEQPVHPKRDERTRPEEDLLSLLFIPFATGPAHADGRRGTYHVISPTSTRL